MNSDSRAWPDCAVTGRVGRGPIVAGLDANDSDSDVVGLAVSGPLDVAAFARLHALRAPRIAWFFGAGASAAAGVATASHMTLDFKARMYATAKGLSLAGLDLADPAVRKRIQSYFGAQPGSPAEGSDDEYGFYFEHAYPAAADRRAYLDAAINQGRPTYGHLG